MEPRFRRASGSKICAGLTGIPDFLFFCRFSWFNRVYSRFNRLLSLFNWKKIEKISIKLRKNSIKSRKKWTFLSCWHGPIPLPYSWWWQSLPSLQPFKKPPPLPAPPPSTDLETDMMQPLRDPNVEKATNTGMIHRMTPNIRSANVWKQQQTQGFRSRVVCLRLHPQPHPQPHPHTSAKAISNHIETDYNDDISVSPQETTDLPFLGNILDRALVPKMFHQIPSSSSYRQRSNSLHKKVHPLFFLSNATHPFVCPGYGPGCPI